MNMDLIQHFINACDSVLAQALHRPIQIGNLSMEQDAYRSKGIAAMIALSGEIEGRVIFDVDPTAAAHLTSVLYGIEKPESEEQIRETIAELANQVIGNAVATLNDAGFRFKVHPPDTQHSDGNAISVDTEALVIRFETSNGSVFMNIAVRYGQACHTKGASA
jgi:CheY-specific phosphatase CheX